MKQGGQCLHWTLFPRGYHLEARAPKMSF